MSSASPTRNSQRAFLLGTLLLLLGAVAHTLWSTSLDSFTLDEPCHIAAGATYLRWGDYRINPEHPPLVKLVAALAETPGVLHLAPFAPLHDKFQERAYTQTAVFLLSDYHRVQSRSRLALILFNTLLLAALTLALRLVFSPAIALATLLLLALDPTVSAHLPVVMTDLPLALLGTLACALAVLSIRCGRWRDWLAFGLTGGLLLGTKHSAPLILLPLLIGCAMTLAAQALRRQHNDLRKQGIRLVAAAALSLAVLWGLYGFRFAESRMHDAQGLPAEHFNRSLDAKIGDLTSQRLRLPLTIANRWHLLPRAYLWGLADTLRSGVEGRPSLVRAFGHDYVDKAPWWIPLADLAVKVPLPFLALALGGIGLLILQRLPGTLGPPMLPFLLLLLFLMTALCRNGVFYAGLRHWLFVVPLLAIPAAACLVVCLRSDTVWAKTVPVAALLLLALPTLPQRRIWEYHNLLAGGSYDAWRSFDNESVDLGQRSDEIIAFCKSHVAPGQPFYSYMTLREQLQANGIREWEPTPEQVSDGYLSGWFIVRAAWLPAQDWRHIQVLKEVTPVARIGNAAIYRGRYYLPYSAGSILIRQGIRELQKRGGDAHKAELYLQRGVLFNNESPSALIELGNLALRRRDQSEALRLYAAAITAEQDSEATRQAIRRQMALVASHDPGETAPMRRPNAE